MTAVIRLRWVLEMETLMISVIMVWGGGVVVVMVCGGGNGNLTLGILRLNDRKSRHRKIKKQRRYERLAATSQLSFL